MFRFKLKYALLRFLWVQWDLPSPSLVRSFKKVSRRANHPFKTPTKDSLSV